MDFLDLLSGAGDAATETPVFEIAPSPFDFSGATDLGDSLGSGFFGSMDDSAVNDLMGLDFDTGVAALQAAGDNGGITGIPALDKILTNLGERWEKDPLSMIGTGIGILGKIDAYRQAKKASKGGSAAVPFVMPPRAEDAYRGPNTAANMPAARNPIAPRGALSQVPVQIPIMKG